MQPQPVSWTTRTLLYALAVVCSACLLLLAAAPGSAHVTVDPSTATQGGYAALAFRVPDEAESAATTKLQVFFPADHPVASVSVRPHPGWHVRVETTKLRAPISTDDGEVTEGVSSVTWTAESASSALRPGEYDEFDVSVGPLPQVSSLTFKTLQTYSDGSVVRWIDPPAADGQPEPEHPAPTLTLVPAGDDTGATVSQPGSADAGSASGDGTATAALAVSVLAALVSVAALAVTLRRGRASRSEPGGG